VKSLPESVHAYRRTSEFSETTVPDALRKAHTTKAGVWGRICVIEGSLVYRILEPEIEEILLVPGSDGVVEPEVRHEVATHGPVRFYVEFLRAE
jgi:tellurite resistance-related uncharacterized protein